jgi:hypothetical protein
VALAAGPSAASAAQKGLDTDLDWGTNSTTQTQTANVVQDSGATWTRLTISWADAEPQAGKYSSSYLSSLDNAVSLMQARGVHIEVFVYESPQWETGNSNPDAPPAHNADFASFLSTMVTRYKGKVAAWEIWNEENTQRFWSTGVNAAQYAGLLKAAYPAVKSVDPNALVIFGGTSLNDYNFLEAAYQAAPDLGHYYDVMATHPYSFNAPPDLTLRDPNGAIDPASFDGYKLVHQTMLNHGDNKPIWFTEFGYATWSGGVTLAQQAAYLTLAYHCIEQDSYVQVANWYNLRNNYWANDANDFEDQLGLLYTNFSPKPAYAAFKAYAPGNTGCVYHEQDGTPTPADGSLPPTGGTTSGGGTTTTPTPTTGTNSTGTSSRGGTTPSPSPTATTTPSLPPEPGANTPRPTHGGLVAARIRTSTSLRVHSAPVRAVLASASRHTAACVMVFVGDVANSRGGVVVVDLERASARGWHQIDSWYTSITAAGRFAVHARCGTAGKLRARATYAGTSRYAPSSSRYVQAPRRS